MIRPRRIAAGADQELITGLLGVRALLDDLRDLIAWIAAEAAPEHPTEAHPDLVDALLGLSALIAAVDRWTPDPRAQPDGRDLDEAPALDAAPAARDLLR